MKDHMMQEIAVTEDRWHPWIFLQNEMEAEAWLQLHNAELQQQILGEKDTTKAVTYQLPIHQGQGICFQLALGGEIYCHTNGDGDILLDVSEEAIWCYPVITACTNTPAPQGRIWLLRGDVLIQLILGLNSLIAQSRLVLKHRFK